MAEEVISADYMITGAQIKTKRTVAGIAGHVLCKKLAIARSRLSDIERGYATVSLEDLGRMDAALDALIRSKNAMQETAKATGWPVAV